MENEISKIQPSKKRQFSFVTITMRKWSVVVAYYLSKIGITALQVLFFCVIVFWGGSLFFFYSNNYIYNFIGLFLIALCHFLDQVDGDLARNHDKVTKVWGFLDGNFDAVVLNSIIFTFTLKFLNNDIDSMYVIAGFSILFGTIFSSKMTALFDNHFHIGCGMGSDRIEEYIKTKKLDWRSNFMYRLITPKWFPFSFLSNFRDYLLLGVLCDGMPIAILGFAIAINIRWIALFIMTALYYHGIDRNYHGKIAIFYLLNESRV
jgi:phosphatidylglycerophosphate synthase